MVTLSTVLPGSSRQSRRDSRDFSRSGGTPTEGGREGRARSRRRPAASSAARSRRRRSGLSVGSVGGMGQLLARSGPQRPTPGDRRAVWRETKPLSLYIPGPSSKRRKKGPEGTVVLTRREVLTRDLESSRSIFSGSGRNPMGSFRYLFARSRTGEFRESVEVAVNPCGKGGKRKTPREMSRGVRS